MLRFLCALWLLGMASERGVAQPTTHWAFTAPRDEVPPEVGAGSALDAIDAYVLAELEERALEPAPEASRATLARRWALDLTGLPPSMATLDAFLADERAGAEERYVDALLASPAFGEHGVRPWLDASSYADSNGYQADGDRQQWPWRDHLIRELNANRPWNELVVEMIAGDLLEDANDDTRLATAFLRNHPINNEGGSIREEVLFQYAVDRVHTTATTFLGLTMACAQCHDHKSDPISQREYYAFQAFFDQIDETGAIDARRENPYHQYEIARPYLERSSEEEREELARARERFRAAADAMKPVSAALERAETEWLANVPDEELHRHPERIASAIRKRRGTSLTGPERSLVRTYFATKVCGDANWSALQREYDAASRALALVNERVPLVMIARDRAERRPTRLRIRGAYDRPDGPALEPSIPALFGEWPAGEERNRLGLARFLTADSNPLFARVMVDRVWRHLFGHGLVPTPEDFGTEGRPPTHPELLEHLAVSFRRSGYDFKQLVRRIVLSATYRRSAVASERSLELDPEARLHSRSPRRRLHAFQLRDQALAIAGLLDRTCFGPPVFPPHPEGLWLDVSFEIFQYPHDRPGHRYRRSVYSFWRRTVVPPDMFDAAARQTCEVANHVTNSPLHALTTWHAPAYVEAARALAHDVLRLGDDDARRIETLFRRATCRTPDPLERGVLARALARERERARHTGPLPPLEPVLPHGVDELELAAWTALAQLVLNLDEVLTRS